MAAKPGGMKGMPAAIIGGGGGPVMPKFVGTAGPPEGVGVAPHDFGVGVEGQALDISATPGSLLLSALDILAPIKTELYGGIPAVLLHGVGA
mmetsp:Transcript_41338/g.105155  ORF Transcript_41338/g.105155 Transcript_41338/m.105155 type:complete len:92 (+) Transcript_41338:888-1163(+)